MARLGDLFLHIRNGANIKQGLDNTGYPITRIETISNRTVDRNKMGYAGITDLEKYSDFVMQDGDILMSHINSETHLGKTALYEKEGDEIIIHGMNLLSLRPNKDLITSKYAFYYLSSQSFLRQIPNITKKSVNQASFTVSALKELVFPLMSIEKQKKITVDLDKVNDLISLRKQQLSKLDELVKSRFVELFGDPVASENKRKLSEIGRIFTGNTPSMKEPSYYESNDIPFLKPSDLNESGVTNIEGVEAHISEKARPVARIIPPNAVLVTCIGTIGKIGITSRESCCNQQINFVVPNDGINSLYLAYCLTFFKSTLQNIANAPVVPIINKTQFSELEVPVFDIDKQNQFAAFVEQTDKSKLAIQKSLEKLETLKKALMQKYFG